MKLQMKLEDLNYGDVAVSLLPRVLPRLQEKISRSEAAAKILTAIAHMPEDILHELFDSIPLKEKNSIVMSLVEENKERILQRLGNEAIQELGIQVSDLTVDEELNLEILFEQIDFVKLAENAIPKLKEHGGEGLSGYMLGALSSMPKSMWSGVIGHIPEEEIIKTGIYLLNHSGNMIPEMLTGLMNRQGIRGSISKFSAKI